MQTKIVGFEVYFFAQNQFSWPNGQLLPIAYNTYSESYGSPKNDDVIYEQPLRLKQLMEMTELIELLESLFLLWIDRADGPSGIGGMKGGN